jgi:hypothetical protein
MSRVQQVLTPGIALLLATVGGYGCNTKRVPDAPAAFGQLNTIAMAYARATEGLDHPPQNKEELMQFLSTTPPDQEDRGPEEPPRPKIDLDAFVIHWGVETRDLPRGRPAEWPVLAYEKQSTDGKRWVACFRRVRQVTDEELSALPFPKGYKAP